MIAEDRISDVLALAARLKLSSGGVLDDAAIDAVAEATGAPVDYVRAAVRTIEGPKKQTALEKVRSQVVTVDARLRFSVLVGSLAAASGLLWSLAVTVPMARDLFASLGVLAVAAAAISSWSSRDRQSSGMLGLLWGGVHFFSYQLIATIASLNPLASGHTKDWPWLLGTMAIGFVAGAVGWDLWAKARHSLGFRDASSERQALVQQLMDIQDRLRQEERHAAFLSLDVVGSTKMKAENDPLAIEFTFSEYHRYIEAIAHRHGGRIHSTAGDGVICVFDEASHGFDAGRAILGGLFEFNAFRNRTNAPIQLRAGLHAGAVGAPGQDAARVDFAHVIDLAAHLQKEVEPNALAVSEAASVDLPGGLDSVGPDRIVVSQVRAAVWRPKTKELAIGQAAAR